MYLTQEQGDEAYKLGRTHLESYVKLTALAMASHALRWKVRPKMHYLDHCMRDVRCLLNPRFFQCFLEEDSMGRVARLSAQVHRTVVGTRTLMRYSILLAVRWFSKSQRRRA
jgi:hypothetical protein